MIDKFEIDESKPKYAIDKLLPGKEETIAVWSKHMLMFDYFSKFWAPRLGIGKKCMNYMLRDIFTRGQRAKYLNIQDKWPIEPQEMKPVINALVGQLMQTERSGRVVMEDDNPPENVAKPEVINAVLKWWMNILKLDQKKEDALRDGLITGYPQWLWFDKVSGIDAPQGNLLASLLPWETALCSPLFMEKDGSDIDELIRVSYKSKAELLEWKPEREKSLTLHEKELDQDPGYISELLQSQHGLVSEDRRNYLYDLVVGSRLESMSGYHMVAEHLYFVKSKQRVYYNEETEDSLILPPDWQNWRKEQWKAQHPEYAIELDAPVKTLWVTTIDSTGFVWENGKHWFQKGILPAVPFIPDMVDNIPVGVGEDMLPYILQIAVSETEGLSQVRKGTGTVTYVSEGTLRHPKMLGKEQSKENGVVILKKGTKPSDAVYVEHRKPNDAYHQVSDRSREQLKVVHGVNEAIQGTVNARQSDVAKRRDIVQGLAMQAPYIRNYNLFQLSVTQLLCHLMPYCLNENHIIEIQDEYGQKTEEHEVNVPTFDYAGQASTLANDITSVEYRIVPVSGDDSPTSREQDLKQFTEILEAVGNTLLQLDPMFLANFLATWPNRYAREAGKYMLENAERMQQQQQEAAMAEQQAEQDKQQQRAAIEVEKMHTPKVNIKLDAKDIQEAPQGFQLLYQLMQQNNQPQAVNA